ncbi:MAG: hypothetical protein MUE36_14095 [Acidimicrobiales bacterium]|jgi:hypothetical protein|nr:hypothetical protein [Acidimicrobiales bacterium]
MSVVAVIADLMDRSRLTAVDADVTFVRDHRALTAALEGSDAGAVTVVVDLARPDALDSVGAAASAGARVIAYGSHVERDRLDAARRVGAEVLARSAFFSRLADLLTS